MSLILCLSHLRDQYLIFTAIARAYRKQSKPWTLCCLKRNELLQFSIFLPVIAYMADARLVNIKKKSNWARCYKLEKEKQLLFLNFSEPEFQFSSLLSNNFTFYDIAGNCAQSQKSKIWDSLLVENSCFSCHLKWLHLCLENI